MKVCVLASGSKGNCTYVETDHHRILIDIGTTCLNIEKKLKEKDINPSSIDMVLMTHAHTDHISGLPVFLKKYNPSVYITPKIEKEAHLKLSNPIYIDSDLEIDSNKNGFITGTPSPSTYGLYQTSKGGGSSYGPQSDVALRPVITLIDGVTIKNSVGEAWIIEKGKVL